MIVVDTSVLIKLVVPEPRSDVARTLRDQALAAPAIWQAEAANVFWRKVQTKELTRAQASSRLETLLDGVVETLPFDTGGAFALSVDIGHPVYDCFFLQAAIAQNTIVVTDDSRFAAAVSRHKMLAARVKLLKDV
jgi:predicted nucleic acid-binding protein